MEAGQPAQPTPGRGGERRGHLPCTRHSPKHMGRGLQCRKHQPQRQQHCSQGDRKERTRLDQSRLEQTPPTITIIHNPPPPPHHCCLSHVYQGKNGEQVQGLQRHKPSGWGGSGSGAASSPTLCHAAQEAQPRFWVGRGGRPELLYWMLRRVFVQGGCVRLGAVHNRIMLSHRRLLQRSETQRFSRLLARTGCAGFYSAEDALRKGLGGGFSTLTVLSATTGVPPAQTRTFSGSE